MKYWEFCDTTFATSDQRRVRQMLDDRWEKNLNDLETCTTSELTHFAGMIAVENSELFQGITSIASSSEELTILQSQKYDKDIGAYITSFQLPKIADAPENFNYHMVRSKKNALPYDTGYELHASPDEYFERGELCYPRPLDPNFDREGKLAGFVYTQEELDENPKRVVAALRSARFTLRCVYDLANLETAPSFQVASASSPEDRPSSW